MPRGTATASASLLAPQSCTRAGARAWQPRGRERRACANIVVAPRRWEVPASRDLINFENPTRRDMVRHGLPAELAEVGFRDIHKVSNHRGAMQVVTAVR